MNSPITPPTEANGKAEKISKASLTELNNMNNRKKIAAKVIGTITHERGHGALHVLELPAPHEIITRRQFNFLRGALLQFGDETAKVAFMHIGANHDAPLGIFARNDRRAVDDL